MEHLLTKQTVAEILGLHPGSVMRLVRNGKFPPPLRIGDIGSRVRWRARDVEAWIEARAAN